MGFLCTGPHRFNASWRVFWGLTPLGVGERAAESRSKRVEILSYQQAIAVHCAMNPGPGRSGPNTYQRNCKSE